MGFDFKLNKILKGVCAVSFLCGLIVLVTAIAFLIPFKGNRFPENDSVIENFIGYSNSIYAFQIIVGLVLMAIGIVSFCLSSTDGKINNCFHFISYSVAVVVCIFVIMYVWIAFDSGISNEFDENFEKVYLDNSTDVNLYVDKIEYAFDCCGYKERCVGEGSYLYSCYDLVISPYSTCNGVVTAFLVIAILVAIYPIFVYGKKTFFGDKNSGEKYDSLLGEN